MAAAAGVVVEEDGVVATEDINLVGIDPTSPCNARAFFIRETGLIRCLSGNFLPQPQHPQTVAMARNEGVIPDDVRLPLKF